MVFCFTEKSMDFSVWCFCLEGWVGNVVCTVIDLKSAQKLWILIKIHGFDLNPQFWPKTAVFIKNCGFNEKMWFSSIKNCGFCPKTMVFTKNHDFPASKMWFSPKTTVFGFSHSCLRFQQRNIYLWPNERPLA